MFFLTSEFFNILNKHSFFSFELKNHSSPLHKRLDKGSPGASLTQHYNSISVNFGVAQLYNSAFFNEFHDTKLAVNFMLS